MQGLGQTATVTDLETGDPPEASGPPIHQKFPSFFGIPQIKRLFLAQFPRHDLPHLRFLKQAVVTVSREKQAMAAIERQLFSPSACKGKTAGQDYRA